MHHLGRVRRALGTIVLAVLFVPILVLAQQPPAQKGKEEKKLDKAQQQEIQALTKLTDAAMAGQTAPNDIPITFKYDFLKARDTRTYVPYIVSIDSTRTTNPSMSMYLRVVKKGAAATDTAAPADAKKDDKQQKARPEYAFEDIYFLDLKAPEAAGQPFRVTRAFSVVGGDYDVYIALKERPVQGGKSDTPPRQTVIKQAATIPDFWNNELATSSIILADKVDQLSAPLSDQQQGQHPYTFGLTQITPAADDKFSKNENLSMIFLVYNTALDANKKPDVVVDYNFYLKQPDGTEKFFNKTNPQAFNASTLPPQFDPAAGHQIVAGQEIPLASFPEGAYRLEIKITDKLANKSVTHNSTFTVTGAS